MGGLLATSDMQLKTAFRGRASFFDDRLQDLLSLDRYQVVRALGERLLEASSDPPSCDDAAAEELFNLVVEICYNAPVA